jgi:hypothetical protein
MAFFDDEDFLPKIIKKYPDPQKLFFSKMTPNIYLLGVAF